MALNANANTLAVVQQNDIKLQEYWNKMILGMITLETSNFIFQNLGVKHSVPVKAGTKLISFRRYNPLPVSVGLTKEQLAEGVPPTPLKVEANKVQGTFNQYGAYIEETDVEAEIGMDDIESIYMPELSRHASEVRERVVMASFSEASEYFVNSAADEDAIVGTDYLTLQEVRKVALIMRNQRRQGHPSYGGRPVLVVHPNVMNDLLDDEDLKDRMLVPGNENTPIKLGTLQKYMTYGFYMVESIMAEVAANSSDVNVYTSYLLGKEPYTVISLGNSGVRFYNTGFKAEKDDPLAQRATFGYKFWVGAKVLDPFTIWKIYSASAYDIALPDFSDDAWARDAIQVILASMTIPATLAQTAKDEEDTLTATVLDDQGNTITDTFDENAYVIVWSSSDTAVCTVESASAYTATVTAIKATSGTATITATLYKKTAAGLVQVGDADTTAYTLTIS